MCFIYNDYAINTITYKCLDGSSLILHKILKQTL